APPANERTNRRAPRGPSSQHRQERSELRERRALSVQRAGGTSVGGVVARFGGDLLRWRKWLGEVDDPRGDRGRRAAADGRGRRSQRRRNCRWAASAWTFVEAHLVSVRVACVLSVREGVVWLDED